MLSVEVLKSYIRFERSPQRT